MAVYKNNEWLFRHGGRPQLKLHKVYGRNDLELPNRVNFSQDRNKTHVRAL